MFLKTFVQNKKIYLAYNNFRRNIFSELSPKDSEAILYLLPWMLSVNDPSVPGYVHDLKRPIAVFGATTDRAIIKREPVFKTMFNIRKQGSLLIPSTQVCYIQGIYTIGSIGTISQTASSDCDIWICIEKADFDEKSKRHLLQKIYLIKDWIDANLKMPVYFFICSVGDIRNSNFGPLDYESSGSAQRNVLKEEFYRTTLMISGKIPLWWVCYDPHGHVDYQKLAARYTDGAFGDYDFIDMGPLDSVDSDEYFGAALWQFNKALTHPLKSIIKMLLLEMLIVSSGEELLCHRFRNSILSQEKEFIFYDPGMFTLRAVLDFYQEIDLDTFEFIKECCYLRYGIKFYSKKVTLKENLARKIFQSFPLTREQIFRLNGFADWPLREQLNFGKKIFSLLVKIYKGITACQKDVISSLTPQDMTIIGRKLATCLETKHHKITVIHKPLLNLNLPTFTFSIERKSWRVFAAGDSSKPVVASADIVYCITYIVWNGIYQDGDVRMTANSRPVTLQEIRNLARTIKEVFGIFDVTGVDFENYLEPEKVTKMLIVISFEGPHAGEGMNEFCLIYRNNWGELFVRRFNSQAKFRGFVESSGRKFVGTEIYYYIQRNSIYYEKIIARTKRLVTEVLLPISRLTE
ncbi:MAG: class I adenylate cyclase [Deltaproteobacteria bacterium]|nr:class I adenylate cyclase [Deltaproteobacteria bacterium]